MAISFAIPLLLCSSAVVIAVCSQAFFDLVGEVQKVDQRYDEHPNQIHEVPVKSQNLDVIRVVAAALVAHTHNDKSDYAGGNVGEVQACDAEKRRPEQSGSPRILKEGHALVNELQPFTNMQQGESNTQSRCNHGPTEGSGFVARPRGSQSEQHGQAAGE